MPAIATKNALEELAKTLQFCLNGLLDEQAHDRGAFPSGWGQFTVIVTRESRNQVQIHVDAGLFSRVIHLLGHVHAEIARKEGSDQIAIVLTPRSQFVA